ARWLSIQHIYLTVITKRAIVSGAHQPPSIPSAPAASLFCSFVSLFCIYANHISFLFKHLRTLQAKHRGWHEKRQFPFRNCLRSVSRFAASIYRLAGQRKVATELGGRA